MLKRLTKKLLWSKNSEQGGGPPDLEEIIKNFFGRKKKKDIGSENESIYSKNAIKNGSGSSNNLSPIFEKLSVKKVFLIVVVVIMIAWTSFGFYVVQPAEQAAITRLGKFSKMVESGLHWYPIGIDNVYKENVQELKTTSLQREMLTSEENIVHISFTVQYRISNLEDYLFANINPTKLLQQALESAVRQVVGENKLEQILTTNRAIITQQVRKEMEGLLRTYKTGIYVSEVIMQPAQAPDAVKSSFDDVIKAREDREREQNNAQSYANRVVPIAEGTAQRILDQANAYKQKVVLEAQGEIAQFNQLLPIYKKSPDIVTNQIYFDTISKVLQHNKIFLIDGDGNKNIFYGLGSSTIKKTITSNLDSQESN